MPLDPINNPGAYRDIRIGGKPIPGAVQDIDGLKDAIEWMTVRAIAGNGWVDHWKGRPPVPSIKITTALHAETPGETSQAWRDHYAFVVHLRGKPPPQISKPPALAVTGAVFKGAGVLSILYVSATSPVFKVGLNTVVYEIKEKGVSTAIAVEEPEPAIIDPSNPSPRSAHEAALQAAANASSGSAPGLTGAEIVARYPGTAELGK